MKNNKIKRLRDELTEEELHALKIFKLQVFFISSFFIMFCISLYCLFIYLCRPELMNFVLKVSVFCYFLTTVPGQICLNKSLLTEKKFRERAIKSTLKRLNKNNKSNKNL